MVCPRSVWISPYLARRPMLGDARAGERLHQAGREGAAQIGPVDRNTGDALALQVAGKARVTVVSTSGNSGIGFLDLGATKPSGLSLRHSAPPGHPTR